MIVGFVEDGQVRVYESLDGVMAEWGNFPSDLLSEVILLYDEDGTWLMPEGVYERWTFLPWPQRLRSVTFERANASEHGRDELGYLLVYEALSLAPNTRFASLDELRERYPFIARTG